MQNRMVRSSLLAIPLISLLVLGVLLQSCLSARDFGGHRPSLAVVIRAGATEQQVSHLRDVLARDKDVIRVKLVSTEQETQRILKRLGHDSGTAILGVPDAVLAVTLSRPLTPTTLRRIRKSIASDQLAQAAVDTSVGMERGFTNVPGSR